MTYYYENKEDILQDRKIYYDNNKESILQDAQIYYEDNKNSIIEKQKEYYSENKSDVLLYQKEYRQENKEKISLNQKKYYEENKISILKQANHYYQDNKKIIIKRGNKYLKKRRANDPVFKLRRNISSSIWYALKKNSSSKDDISCMMYLPYTIRELKEYLEELFEPWMNWNNYGIYNKELWFDNDPSTWTWQIDHIIPQSDLPYTSMEDENFKICWSLENLRPLSAKQNILDGTQRSRHKK